MAFNLWNWITGIFKSIANLLDKPADIAIKIVNVIKDFIDNPLIDVITRLTRTDIDDKIVAIIRSELHVLLQNMMKADSQIHDLGNASPESVHRYFAQFIADMKPDARRKWYVELAYQVLQLITGKGIPPSVGISVTQAKYFKS